MAKNNFIASEEILPSLNHLPAVFQHIHLMGICGTAMASLAGMLKQEGYIVTGSDQHIYPPMSYFLREMSIPVLEGYGPENLNPRPDLVIVGNVITRQNPESQELARLKIPYLSLPQALRVFAMEGKRSIVVCGTHGKTTTSALIAWILEKADLDPGFMIGGIPGNFQKNFKLGKGPYFVIEGDEYDTAFFDKGPKFLHYAPWVAILTSIEFDHADIYRDLEHVKESFSKLIALIPPDGLLIANGDDPLVMELSEKAKSPVVTYGFKEGLDWRATEVCVDPEVTTLNVIHKNGPAMTGIRAHERDQEENGRERPVRQAHGPEGTRRAPCRSSVVPGNGHCPVPLNGTLAVHYNSRIPEFQNSRISSHKFTTPLYGRHNISNLLSGVVLSDFLGIETSRLQIAMESFSGVKRRQEIRGEKKGVLVLDDFAHHPTAVRETIRAVKEKYRDRRLIAVFEPRSNSSRRNIFQEAYAVAFDQADLVMIPEPPLMANIPMDQRFSSQRLVQDLQKRGLHASYFVDTTFLLEGILHEAAQGDVILIMSNGGFDNLHARLLEKLP